MTVYNAVSSLSPSPIISTTRTSRVLIIEDDADLNHLIKFSLEQTGSIEAMSLFEGRGVISSVFEFKPDLIVLDVMLPGLFGTDILKALRQEPQTANIPVILVTARSSEDDKIIGLELGADDYVTKPFSPRELVLRVSAVLKRTVVRQERGLDASIRIGQIVIYPSEYKVTVGGTPIDLTAIEFRFLLFLAERVGRLQSRDVLLKEVWQYEGSVNTRTVDTHVKRLRCKLGSEGRLIETAHGFGYRIVDIPVLEQV